MILAEYSVHRCSAATPITSSRLQASHYALGTALPDHSSRLTQYFLVSHRYRCEMDLNATRKSRSQSFLVCDASAWRRTYEG